MLSIRHITTAGALAVVLATPATGFAQVLRGHDLHAAQPAQTGHVLRGHDLHAADTTGATAVNRAVEESAATPASGFDWEDAGIDRKSVV